MVLSVVRFLEMMQIAIIFWYGLLCLGAYSQLFSFAVEDGAGPHRHGGWGESVSKARIDNSITKGLQSHCFLKPKTINIEM